MLTQRLTFAVLFFASGFAQLMGQSLSGKVSIKSDLGTYLCMCMNCQQSTTDYTATLHCQTNTEQYTQFEMVYLSNGYYAFKAFNGKYMAVCTHCVTNTTVPHFITFHAASPNESYAQFEVTRLSNGRYSIKSPHVSKYLGRCNGCSPSSTTPNQVAAHAGDAGPAWAQWEIQSVSALSGNISFRSDIGTYLSMCLNCQKATTGYTAMLHSTANNEPFTRFTVVPLSNGKYAFKTFEGKYMTVCTGCIINGTAEHFITFHATSPDEPYAQFEITPLGNGKYSIRSAHVNKYIARCNGCSPTANTPNQVAAHAGDAGPGWAQWEIVQVN